MNIQMKQVFGDRSNCRWKSDLAGRTQYLKQMASNMASEKYQQGTSTALNGRPGIGNIITTWASREGDMK